MRRVRWIAALAAAGLLLVSCGGGKSSEEKPLRPLSPPRELHLGLDGYASPATAGIMMAEKRGYFEPRGLDVWITSPGSPLSPIPYVVQEEVDIGISHLPELALAQQEGAPIVAVGSLVSETTASVIWPRKSKNRGIADLKGKTIAMTGLPFQEEFLGSVLARAGLSLADVKIQRAGYDAVPALVGGRADAIFGGSASVEGAALESRGLEPVVTSVRDLGVPDYEELVLIARRDRLAEEPRLYRNFLSAVARGTAEATEDPKAAANAILESVYSHPELSRKEMEAGVEKTLPLLSRDGRMDPDQAEQLTEWMREEGMTRQALPAAELLTNSYLEPPRP
jgi:putative hydroxymethylpyrimidine transport system substrate-binding protein